MVPVTAKCPSSHSPKPFGSRLSSRIGSRKWGVLLIVCVVAIGCERKWDNASRPRTSRSSADQSSYAVGEAMKYLPMLMRLDRSVAVKEVVFQLNSWAQGKTAPPNERTAWLLSTLPPDSFENPILQNLNQMRFGEPESEYLLQCQMMKQVCGWILGEPYRDGLFDDWLQETGSKLSDQDRRKLEATLKLFDWTVRNVALEGVPSDIETLTPNPEFPINDAGIGYRQLPWQTMIFGRGDAWQRIRVFNQLLQQVDVTAAVFAFPSDSEDGPLLWAVGVPIAGEVYLFDPKWGLPIPGANQKGIATFKQASSDRNILRRAKLPGQFEYPVDMTDLSNAIALIDLEPFAIDSSMEQLEKSLAGENRMNIYVDAAAAAEPFVNALDETRVKLWTMPLLAQTYNASVRGRLFDQSPFSLRYLAVYGPFFTDTLLNSARQDHFKGQFQSTLDKPGALKNYMGVRVDDETLNKLSSDLDTQRAMQVVKELDESREQFAARVEQVKGFYRAAKYHTSTFLGMAQFDLGNIDAAINWLDERTLQVEGTDAWHPHATYLLARSYEIKGDTEKAIEYLKSDDVPQEAGNRIRARLLQSILQPEIAE